jgi:subfamily B ATP-binding cassette protein MsbA
VSEVPGKPATLAAATVTVTPAEAAAAAADAALDEGRERSHWEELARLVPYARDHRLLLGLTLAFSLLLAVIDVPVPFMLKHIIDAVLKHHSRLMLLGRPVEPETFLLGLFVALAGLALVKGVLVYVQRTVSETIGQYMVYAMRLDLYRQLQSLSMRWFREARTGKLMLRLMGDINAVLDMITDGYMRALMDMVTVLAVLVSIFLVNWKLAFIVLVAMPIYLAAFLSLNPRLRQSGRAARRERSALSGHLQEKIAGAVIVKAFVQEDAESGRVEAQTGRLRDRLIEKARWGGLLTAVANTTVALGAAMVLWFGGREVLAGIMTKGSLMAFYSLSSMLFPPLRRLAKTNETYQASRVSLDRILDFFDDTTPFQERAGGPELRVTRGDVAFEGIHFSYVPGKPVLQGITLRARGGETIALVGANGAGKTTLISHLLRFLNPESGRVLIDGQDVQQVDLKSLRRQIGVVTQETILFSGTIAENIRYGLPEATDEQVLEAARIANAYEFIVQLPNGFQTDVGERGQRLSGGQLQRIALARAVLSDPPILVLDEATSAVDAESEALIQEALARLTRGRTTFVIAHRMSTVRRANRIVVMQDGRIVEEGRHDELLSRGGDYRKLFAEQLFDVPGAAVLSR